MESFMNTLIRALGLISLTLIALPAFAEVNTDLTQRFVQVDAKTREQRTTAENAGMSIEFLRSDSVWGFADAKSIADMQSHGLTILGNFDMKMGRGGHQGAGFPQKDERFHDYAEVKAKLYQLEKENPEMAKVHIIGTSLEGREILALHLNTTAASLKAGRSNKPGMIYMASHHAREHLSTEMPLMFADYLLKNKKDATLSALLSDRDIWFIPLVNPDGSEFDISEGSYEMWRKNRRPNGDGTFGVDLNRNYGYKWGTGGSSTSTNSDVYMGAKPFSEPETQVIKNFVESHLNAKVLLTIHTFSELILYPWGNTYDGIENAKDEAVFTTMAKDMAKWNKYTPQQSSDLYITSGDTTDWAYGEHGIFAFTFELSPTSIWDGGFYPGQKAIDPTFAANVKPFLYLLELADDPYRATAGSSTPSGPSKTPNSSWPSVISAKNKFEIHPFHF
jgi:carboxypeptidase T